ncbi:MAG: hypothetical protein J0H92_17820 [Sphingobacteriales bacterium]|nr:hypothetical protein [Sphingobacteriales bacterium]
MKGISGKKNGLLVTLICAAMLCTATAGAQTAFKVEMPQLVPASPESVAFMKAGLGTVNKSTGGMSLQVPLYVIRLGSFSWPLSLSYQTQGLKADEASSRVGHGWSLQAGGVITRSVKGSPDEFSSRLSERPDYSVDSGGLYEFSMNASNSSSGIDAQPDEFQFSVNGYSGKFVLDSNYVARVNAASNVRIDVQISATPMSTSGSISRIVLTTPDGVRYYFGDAYERTDDLNMMQYNAYKHVLRTSFFLDRIVLPGRDSIMFSYSSINTEYVTGITQTYRQSIGGEGDGVCADCSSYLSYTTQEDKVSYITRYLTGITTSDGQSVSFLYEDRPDLGDDNRLRSLQVPGLKRYDFKYYDVAGSASRITGRFFLTDILEYQNERDVAYLDSLHGYHFTYAGLSEVPLPITFSQDYLGYYNGRNLGYFIPPMLNANNSIDFSFRSPDPAKARLGTLVKVRYPTGGSEEFAYEANTITETAKRYTKKHLGVEGNGSSGTFPVYQAFFTAVRNETVSFSTYATDYNLSDGYGPEEDQVSVVANVYEGSTLLASRSAKGVSTNAATVSVQAGHTYKFEISVRNEYARGYGLIVYDTSATDIYDTGNAVVPGVRLQSIKKIDHLTGDTVKTFYKYAGLANINLSSGHLLGTPDYRTETVIKTFCGDFGAFETSCQVVNYSSSSTNAVYSYGYGGSLLYYSSLLESDDSLFVNGGTETVFYNHEMGGNHLALLGSADIPYMSMGQFPTLSGFVKEVRVFNQAFEIVSKEETEYETDILVSPIVHSYYVRKRYEPWSSRQDRMEAFDIIRTHYVDYWIRPKYKRSIHYAGGDSLLSQTDFSYGSHANPLVRTQTTLNSKGVAERQEMYYATDYATDPVYRKLVGKNMIGVPVEQKQFYGDSLRGHTKTLYRDWFGDSSYVLPEFVRLRTRTMDTLSTELVYTQYDNRGNPLAVGRQPDQTAIYLWDSVYRLPVCEVKYALVSQVAYAGLANNNTFGNWSYTSGSLSGSGGFTGDYTFSGVLTKTVPSGSYLVQLWSKAVSVPQVNGTNGVLKRTVREWKLYQWQLSNPGLVTVSGSELDDIRLYPSGALMQTYTYIPLIGMSSATDARNNAVYYEYDGDARLTIIRNADNHVIRKINYAYRSYGVSSAVWRSTGNLRCKPCPANAAYSINMQQHEEVDINPNSSGYQSTRWVDDNVAGSCVITADWQMQSVSCQQSGGQNTGYQLITEKDMNPCSGTYNTTRNRTEVNLTACPVPCNTSNCSGVDKKCVGGVCETGVRINISTVYMKNSAQQWIWRCSYYYRWSDCTTSTTYTEDNTTACTINSGPCGGGGEE